MVTARDTWRRPGGTATAPSSSSSPCEHWGAHDEEVACSMEMTWLGFYEPDAVELLVEYLTGKDIL